MRKQIFLVFFLLFSIFASAQVQLTNLLCEQTKTPLGIDVKNPRLSWNLSSIERNVQQVKYKIIVGNTPSTLKEDKGNVYQTDYITSSNSILIPIEAKLESNKKYFWKVIVISNKSTTPIEATSFFTTGLLKTEDWKASWIGYDKASPWDSITQWSRLSARYFRKEFETTNKIKRATAFISGLGLYELYINGKKIGDQVLAPNPTDYRKTVYYNTFDVTNNIATKNAIGVVLGNGRFFTMRQNYKTHKHNTFGYPKLKLQVEIEYVDGKKETIVTDNTWKLNVDGPIRTNNEYDGEEYDATKEFGAWTSVNYKDAKWQNTELVDAPLGKLQSQLIAPMKIMKTITAKSFKQIGNKYIVDFGQNFSGVVNITAKAKKGDTLTMRFAESLQTNGELYTANLRDAKVTNNYIFSGKPNGETWQPSFVYNGFRYIEITGLHTKLSLQSIEGKLIFDALETSGNFETSNSTINQIYKNAWWGIASNYKGMPIDCPQRNERQPWLGDRTIGAIGESYVFNNANLYSKWMQDIEESQTEEGAIPDVAPAFWNYYTDNITWPAAFITITNNLYNQFGDIKPIEKHYTAIKKWMQYMEQKYLKEHIMTKDKYGDWCVPPETLELIHAKDSSRITNGSLIATAYYYKLLSYTERFANLLNKKEDASNFAVLAKNIKNAFQQKFYNNKLKQYDNGTVTANLLPLYFGIAPDSVKQAIADKIRNKIYVESKAHITTGVVGTQYLMRGLTELKLFDLAYTLASNTTYPSWGYMAKNNATTIWELWNGNTANPQMNSQNHVMLLGDLLIWFYENLGAIRTDKTEVGFKKIIMRPTIPTDLKNVTTTYRSAYGHITSAWEKKENIFKWTINIPANTSAVVHLPATSIITIYESGKSIANNKDIKIIKEEAQTIIVEINSGTYNFSINKEWKNGIVSDEFIYERAAFPECHAATIVETPKGLKAAWFGGTKEGNKDVCIYTSDLVRNVWSVPTKVADGIMNDSTRYACYNPVLFQVPNGELLLFYKVGPNVAGWKAFMKTSKDNGYTWSVAIPLPDGYLGPIKNKPILFGKKLFCPSSTEVGGWKAHIEFYDLETKQWSKTNALNNPKIINAIQPSILTYKNGAMQILCRSQNTTLNESWSYDNAQTWTEMKASNLPNNNSGTDAVTLKDGRQLLVYNHAMPDSTWVKGKGPRTPLNIAISVDGTNWNAVAILEDAPISQYSYPSVIQTQDGFVHIVYTWRRERIKHVVLDLSKIKTEPIKNKQWPGSKKANGNVTDD